MNRDRVPQIPTDVRAGTAAPALDVFALRDRVVDEYSQFATSFTTIHAPDVREQVEAIYAEQRYWPEPLIQINPSYKRGANIEALIAASPWTASPADGPGRR